MNKGAENAMLSFQLDEKLVTFKFRKKESFNLFVT